MSMTATATHCNDIKTLLSSRFNAEGPVHMTVIQPRKLTLVAMIERQTGPTTSRDFDTLHYITIH
jgi:hypothetical protein